MSTASDLIAAAAALYPKASYPGAQIAALRPRLVEPLRVALAGSLKAGKSTLLNALVGQDIAPTDATECTRVVTWYRRGPAPVVTARCDDNAAVNIPVQRHSGRLTFDFGGRPVDSVRSLDVEWPAAALRHMTIVDTPGISSLSSDVSRRTHELLTPDQSGSHVDAVVYLMRTVNAADVEFLREISERVSGDGGALGVIGVASRADEIGSGRLDAMLSAKDVASRFTRELDKTGLCQAVVPVAGLLALAARTLTQTEFIALHALSELPSNTLELALLSVDRFSAMELPVAVDGAMRATLVDRFGMFGVKLALTLLRLGTKDSPSLAAELLARSGLADLQEIVEVQFGQRAAALKTHSTLLELRRILLAHPVTGSAEIADRAGQILSDAHGFAELRLLGRLRAHSGDFSADDLAELERVIGRFGTDARTRLGLGADVSADDVTRTAREAVLRWRSAARNPLFDQFTSRACVLAARSAEGLTG